MINKRLKRLQQFYTPFTKRLHISMHNMKGSRALPHRKRMSNSEKDRNTNRCYAAYKPGNEIIWKQRAVRLLAVCLSQKQIPAIHGILFDEIKLTCAYALNRSINTLLLSKQFTYPAQNQ